MGMLRVVFNIEAGNDYSKSTFIMTLIKQEKVVFILVILYIREYLCVFTKLFMNNLVSEDFQFWISGSRYNQESTALTRSTQPCVKIDRQRSINLEACIFLFAALYLLMFNANV